MKASQLKRWALINSIWMAAALLLVAGAVANERRSLAVGLFMAVVAASVTSWVTSEVVVRKVATEVAEEERIEVETMACAVARVLVQEYKLGRLPSSK